MKVSRVVNLLWLGNWINKDTAIVTTKKGRARSLYYFT